MKAVVMHEKPIRRRSASGKEYWLTLSHEPGALKTGRVDGGQVPLLLDHQATIDAMVGRVSKIWQQPGGKNRETHAEFDFYDSPDNPKIADVRAKLQQGHRGLSVGLTTMRDFEKTGPDSWTARDWEVGELTVTPTPADDETTTYGLHLSDMAEKQFAAVIDAAEQEANMEKEQMEAFAAAFGKQMQESQSQLVDSVVTRLGSLWSGGEKVWEDGKWIDKPAESEGKATEDKVEDKAEDKAEDGKAEAEDKAEDKAEESKADESKDESESEEDATNAAQSQIGKMADIAAGMETYDAAKVRELQIQSIAESWSAKQFGEKLKSIVIQPAPQAPVGDTGMGSYNLLKAMDEIYSGRQGVGLEAALSDEICNSSMMATSRGAYAIPLSVFDEGLTEAEKKFTTQAAGYDDSTQTIIDRLLRKDIPDPLAIRGLVSMMRAGPGKPQITLLTVPDPEMVAEPTEAYVETGTTTDEPIEFTPHIEVHYQKVTRLARALAPAALALQARIARDKMRELQNSQILTGDGTGNNVLGIYAKSNIGSSANRAGANAITISDLRTALRASWKRGGSGNRRLIVGPDTVDYMKNMASPASVAAFFTPSEGDGSMAGVADGIQVLRTGVFGNKDARCVAGPLGDTYLKEWDNALFASTQYREGVLHLVLELFWDYQIPYPELFHRIRQD